MAPRPPSLPAVRICIAAGPPRRARAPTLPQAPDPIALPAPPLPSAHYHISSHLSHTHLSVVQPPLLVPLARVHRAPSGSGISGSHQDGPLLVYHLSVPHHHPYVHPGPSPPPSAPAAPCLSFRPSVHPCVCALRPLVCPVHIWPPVPSLHPPARYQHIIIGVRGACTPVRRRSSLRLREPYRIHSAWSPFCTYRRHRGPARARSTFVRAQCGPPAQSKTWKIIFVVTVGGA